jgi:hypothetical protein
MELPRPLHVMLIMPDERKSKLVCVTSYAGEIQELCNLYEYSEKTSYVYAGERYNSLHDSFIDVAFRAIDEEELEGKRPDVTLQFTEVEPGSTVQTPVGVFLVRTDY